MVLIGKFWRPQLGGVIQPASGQASHNEIDRAAEAGLKSEAAVDECTAGFTLSLPALTCG